MDIHLGELTEVLPTLVFDKWVGDAVHYKALPTYVKLTGNHCEWESTDGGDWPKVGDTVGERVQDYFIEVLPPAAWTAELIQLGEAANHTREGWPTYSTLIYHEDTWVFVGDHPRRALPTIIGE